MRSGGLPLVLFASSKLNLGRSDQPFPLQDALHRRLTHRQPQVVSDPGGQLPAAPLRRLPGRRQYCGLPWWAKPVPGGPGNGVRAVLLPLQFTGPPPGIGAPGHLQLGGQPPFSPPGLFHPGYDVRLLPGAHAPVPSSRAGVAVFFKRWTSRERSASSCFRGEQAEMNDLIRVTERLAPLGTQVNRATAVGNGGPQAYKAPHYLG